MDKSFKVTVAGAGVMGQRIAQVIAQYGYTVTLYNRSESKFAPALEQIRKNLESLAELGQIAPADIAPVFERIVCTSDFEAAMKDADMVIESVSENKDLKREFFAKLSAFCRKDCILTSNTSSINIFECVEVEAPERLVITHFFHPAYVMPLVELVKGPETSEKTADTAKEFLESIGKRVAVLNKVIPGFILNRISMAILREASYIVEQGAATPEDVDMVMESLMGPRYAFEASFRLCDFCGLDIMKDLSGLLFPVLSDAKTTPQLILDKVAEGNLGPKQGNGFYDYPDPAESLKKRDVRIVKMLQAIDKIRKETE